MVGKDHKKRVTCFEKVVIIAIGGTIAMVRDISGGSCLLTASTKDIDELGTDDPRNVLFSVGVAASEKARNMGVMVCLNDGIHSAREVIKTCTSNVETFESSGYSPLGIVDEDTSYFSKSP